MATSNFTIKAPPGFETALLEQETIVDILLDGKKVAASPAVFNHKTIRFHAPDQLVALLPSIRDHAMVASALDGTLPNNREMSCQHPDAPKNCDQLQPDTAAVIFNPDTLEANLFISDRYTYSRNDKARYLPPPTKAAGLIVGLNARGYQDFKTRQTNLTSNLNLITGYGRTAFRAEIFSNLSDGNFAQNNTHLRQANLTYMGKRHETVAGILPYRSGSNLAQSDRVLGFRYGSTLKTRLDTDTLRAAAIPININSPARVIVMMDGKTIDIQRLEPHETTLDTSRFPRGSYDVTLKITENGVERTETRYFTSGGGLPPTGEAQWYVQAGFPTRHISQNNFLPSVRNNPVLRAGYETRIGARLGIGGTASLSRDNQYLEARADYVGNQHSLSVGALASADQDYGAYVRGRYNTGKVQIAANYREVRTRNSGIITTTSDPNNPFPQSYRQAGGQASVRMKRGQAGVRGFYRQTGDQKAVYFGGPYAELNVIKSKTHRLSVTAQAERGNHRNSYYVGVRLASQLRGPSSKTHPSQRISVHSSASIRSDTTILSDGTKTMAKVREIAETKLQLNRPNAQGYSSQYYVGARYANDQIGGRIGLRKRSSIGDVGVELRHDYNNQRNVFASINTGLAIGGGSIAAAPRYQESGVMVSMDGNDPSPYRVLANGAQRNHTSQSKAAFVDLPAYQIHDVAVRPDHSNDVDYENHADRVVLYPGNIAPVKRRSNTVKIMIGQAIDGGGTPISDAAILDTEQIAFTDENGHFQIDYKGQDSLTLTKAGQVICTLSLATQVQIDQAQEFMDVGPVTCNQ